MHAIEVKNITKIFKNKFKALNSVSFSVGKGEIHGLLGPNGAGKSTMINILSTVLLPDSGTAKILGYDIARQSREIRRRIGICSGEGKSFWSFTGKETLNYYGMLHGLDRRKRKERIEFLADKFGLKGFYNKQFNEYSRGMKQKLVFARTLISDPEVLLLDEPTSGMDVDVAIDMRNMLIELTEQGKTILLTSHNMHEVEAICKNITLINNGRVVVSGSIESIKNKIKFNDIISLILDRYDNLDFLRKINGVRGFHIDEDRLNINVKSSKDSIQNILNALKAKGYKIKDLEISDINLEDAFLKLVGGRNVRNY